MRWVNDTLPPRARARWLLMTVRLSQSSLTGTERTDVAVGTLNDASMLAAVRAGAPRRTVKVGSSLVWVGVAGLGAFATGVVVPLAGSSAAAAGRGVDFGAGFSAAFAEACSGACSGALAGAFAFVAAAG